MRNVFLLGKLVVLEQGAIATFLECQPINEIEVLLFTHTCYKLTLLRFTLSEAPKSNAKLIPSL